MKWQCPSVLFVALACAPVAAQPEGLVRAVVVNGDLSPNSSAIQLEGLAGEVSRQIEQAKQEIDAAAEAAASNVINDTTLADRPLPEMPSSDQSSPAKQLSSNSATNAASVSTGATSALVQSPGSEAVTSTNSGFGQVPPAAIPPTADTGRSTTTVADLVSELDRLTAFAQAQANPQAGNQTSALQANANQTALVGHNSAPADGGQLATGQPIQNVFGRPSQPAAVGVTPQAVAAGIPAATAANVAVGRQAVQQNVVAQQTLLQQPVSPNSVSPQVSPVQHMQAQRQPQRRQLLTAPGSARGLPYGYGAAGSSAMPGYGTTYPASAMPAPPSIGNPSLASPQAYLQGPEIPILSEPLGASSPSRANSLWDGRVSGGKPSLPPLWGSGQNRKSSTPQTATKTSPWQWMRSKTKTR